MPVVTYSKRDVNSECSQMTLLHGTQFSTTANGRMKNCETIFAKMLKKIVVQVLELLILGALKPLVWEVGTGSRRRVKGSKQHIITDTMGLLLAVAVHAANMHDSQSAFTVMGQLKYRFSR